MDVKYFVASGREYNLLGRTSPAANSLAGASGVLQFCQGSFLLYKITTMVELEKDNSYQLKYFATCAIICRRSAAPFGVGG
jgi:hypothetical protein